jgi:hypothetical protein
MNIKLTRIATPKYKVGRYTLNEYEVRNLMLEVAKGEKPSGIKIKDSTGKVVEVLPNGNLSDTIAGFSIADELGMHLYRIQRKEYQTK